MHVLHCCRRNSRKLSKIIQQFEQAAGKNPGRAGEGDGDDHEPTDTDVVEKVTMFVEKNEQLKRWAIATIAAVDMCGCRCGCCCCDVCHLTVVLGSEHQQRQQERRDRQCSRLQTDAILRHRHRLDAELARRVSAAVSQCSGEHLFFTSTDEFNNGGLWLQNTILSARDRAWVATPQVLAQ